MRAKPRVVSIAAISALALLGAAPAPASSPPPAQKAAPVFFYHLDWVTPVLGGKRYVPHALDIGRLRDPVMHDPPVRHPQARLLD